MCEMEKIREINWLKCEEYALKNIVKEVCDYWHKHKEINKENIIPEDVCSIFGVSKTCIIDYLNKGTKLKWCTYTGIKIPILIYDLDMNYITKGESASWIQKISKEKFGIYLNRRKIADTCKGVLDNYKGYIFRYAD